MSSERFNIPPARLAADSNIRFHYPIQHGHWIVHPGIDPREDSFCRYCLEFDLPEATAIEIHVSADNRFELRCDDCYVGMGPDRSDIEHWSFHSYRMMLSAGSHRLAADVHYLYKDHPLAQTSVEPGFLLYSGDSPVDLNTGSAAWRVARLRGVSTGRAPVKGFFVVGPNYIIDGSAYFAAPDWVDPIVVHAAGHEIAGGRIMPGWKLHPTRLPEQVRRPVGGGVIRYVGDIAEDAPFPEDAPASDPAWQGFIAGQGELTVPAHTRTVVLWDLQQYHTAYPEVTTRAGEGAGIKVEWAESCFVATQRVQGRDARHKGNRDEIAGKFFLGNGDTFLPDGPRRTFRPFWWRAGRYVRLTVETGDQPLTLEKIVLQETRMPLENDSLFESSDADFPRIVNVSVRGIQMCAHETYMDCPYYEQLMYVGDTRIQVLTAYVMNGEDRLNKRALEMFDWSRRETGYVLERYPSDPKQLSTTFAMVWILMLRDFAWWRDEPDFVRERLKGMRCLLEEFKAHLGDAELLPPLPGWSFMDWVDGLSFVNPPGPNASVASVVNLLLINALNAAVELEEAFGEQHLADYNRAWAERLAKAVDSQFWHEERGLLADDPQHKHFSEHAQCLALLSGLFPHRQTRCFESLVSAEDLRRTTVYFSFYLLETFAKFGRGDLILEKLEFWKQMVRRGFRTPVEMPEPARSDCHAWGSHPLFHMHASLAGVRPGAPGFRKVRIEPKPGSLTELASTIPHPKGTVSLRLDKSDGDWHAKVELPPGVTGELVWQGRTSALKTTAEIVLPAEKGE